MSIRPPVAAPARMLRLGATACVSALAWASFACAAPASSDVQDASRQDESHQDGDAPVAAADPMAPTSSSDDALTSPLRMVTVTTSDMTASRRFYQGALDLTPQEMALEGDDRARFAAHYATPESATGRVTIFRRHGLDDAMLVRLIEIGADAPESRIDHNGRYDGPLGFGFSARDLASRETIVNAHGFSAVKSVVEMDFPRADGTTYTVGEIHFRAPDSVLVLGVDRGPLTPVGQIDEALMMGGPSYASMLMSSAEAVTPLFADVLGLERRREMSFTASGPDGGMGLDAGAEVLFQQWFSPGSTSGYLVMMEILTGGLDAPAPLDLTSRGVSMWSFETDDIDALMARAEAADTHVLSGPTTLNLPSFGLVQSVVFATADGFPVEVFTRLPAPQDDALD